MQSIEKEPIEKIERFRKRRFTDFSNLLAFVGQFTKMLGDLIRISLQRHMCPFQNKGNLFLKGRNYFMQLASLVNVLLTTVGLYTGLHCKAY